MPLIKKIITWRNYLVFYVVLIILCNIFLLGYPLTNVFGFEFSVLNSIILVLLSGFYTLSLLKKHDTPGSFFKVSLTSAIIFLVLPALISMTHDLLTISCSIWDGFLFYAFITLPSVIIGAALALLSVFISQKFRYPLFVLAVLVVLSIPFFELYYYPQIYFYNPIFAYFPGTIYDEAISVDLNLILYRSLNLIFFGAIYFTGVYVHYEKRVITRQIVIYIALLISALFIYLSPDFNFSTSQTKLKSILGKLVKTEHFEIYFSPDISPGEIKIITLNHEYYYEQLANFYRLIPKEKYTSFIFKDDDQKKKYFGSENADVAKPWLREIFTIANNYNSSLRHEIAHCFAGEFGWSIFRVADGFNPSLIEGAAVAGAPEYDLNDIHYMASLAYENGYKINLNTLFGGLNFFGQTSGLSYIYAGSFCKYLIDRYGIEKFKQLYASADFLKVYQKDLDNLSSEYYSFISDQYEILNRPQADYYFGKKPVIYKTCPRFIAKRLKEAWQFYSAKNYPKALDLFTGILKLTDSYPALVGYANALFNTGEKAETINILKNKINDFKKTSYFYSIEFALADFCSQVHDTSYADSLYKNIMLENPNRTLYYLSRIREKLLNSDSLIVPYLEGSDFDKYLILTRLNKSSYDYFSIPVMTDLAESLAESPDLFLGLFDKTIIVNSFESSFAVYRLSVYLSSHLDFLKARRMAALAMRYTKDKNFNFILQENFNKAGWLFENGNAMLSTINFK